MAQGQFLTPEWLMEDIQSLLHKPAYGGPGDMMSEAEFAEEYGTGHVTDYSWLDVGGSVLDAFGFLLTGNQGSGMDMDVRHYYDFEDFGEEGLGMEYYEAGDKGHTQHRGGLGTTHRTPQGYEFESSAAAYEAYKKLWNEEQARLTGVGEGGQGPVNIWDPGSLSVGVAEAKGAATPPPETFTALTPGMMRKLHTGSYAEDIEESRDPLIDQLIKKQKLAAAKGGGFSGYGGRQTAEDIAQTKYLAGVEDIYAGIGEQQAAGLQEIYDVLGQYEAIGEGIEGA